VVWDTTGMLLDSVDLCAMTAGYKPNEAVGSCTPCSHLHSVWCRWHLPVLWRGACCRWLSLIHEAGTLLGPLHSAQAVWVLSPCLHFFPFITALFSTNFLLLCPNFAMRL
jgi:hypothetical protein